MPKDGGSDRRSAAGGVLLALPVLLGLIGPTAQATPYTSLYVFGDSDSDNGNRFALEGIPVPPYYDGRHSNGPVEVEVLANDLGATLHDYAVGGAFSGHGNIDTNPVVANTGVLDQVGQFITALGGGSADPNALYIIGGGGNDFTQFGQTVATADGIIANDETAITNLELAGATHFFVWTRGNFGVDFPALLSIDLGSFAAAKGYDIDFYNAVPLITEMLQPVDNPFRFTHFAGDPCFTGTLSSGVTGGATLCSDPQDYVFWDPNDHLTARAYAILGDAMADTIVPEPSSVAMLLSGLGVAALVLQRRRRRERPASSEPSDASRQASRSVG